MKHLQTFESFLQESQNTDLDKVNEDSAGTFELEKDWTGKDIKGKRVTLKKGTRLKHERSGGFGQDYMKAGSITIDAGEIGRDYLSAPY
jgi:hypothetical protein